MTSKRQRRKQRVQLDADVSVKTEPPQGQVSVKIHSPEAEIDPTKNLVSVSGSRNVHCCLFNLLL